MNLIFDIDGTLWDSTDTVADAWNQVVNELPELNLHFTGDQLKNLFGKPMDEICALAFPMLSREEGLALGNRCFSFENQYLYEHPGRMYPGVLRTLEHLAQSHSLYIVSNCQDGYIPAVLHGTGLSHLIRDSLCFGETGTCKAETIRTLMQRHHLSEAWYIGDTQGDLDAAHGAGIPFVYCAYGFGDAEGYEKKIGRFEELMELFG